MSDQTLLLKNADSEGLGLSGLVQSGRSGPAGPGLLSVLPCAVLCVVSVVLRCSFGAVFCVAVCAVSVLVSVLFRCCVLCCVL